MKLKDLDDCEQSEGVHALIKQEYPKFRYCPWCGKNLLNLMEQIFREISPQVCPKKEEES